MLPITEGIMDRIKGNNSMDNVIMRLELEDPVMTTMETTLTKSPTKLDSDDKYTSMITDDKYAQKTKSLDKYTLHVLSHDDSEIPVMKGNTMYKQKTVIREEPISVIRKKDLVGWRKLMFKPRNKNPSPTSSTESDSSSYTLSTSLSDMTPSSSVWYEKPMNGIEEEEEHSSEEEYSDHIGSSFAELIVDFISCNLCDMDVYDDESYTASSIPRVVKFRTNNSSRRKR